MVSLDLCKEYLKVMIFKISLTPDKELHVLIYQTPSYVIVYKSYELINLVRFFVLTPMYVKMQSRATDPDDLATADICAYFCNVSDNFALSTSIPHKSHP